MAYVSIAATDVDAKSPIDDSLMELIKANEDDLDSRITTAGAKHVIFELQGKLSFINTHKRSVAMGFINEAFQPSLCRFMLKKSGSSALGFDLRKHTSPGTPITEIAHQYSAATSSISRKGSALNTQSIARFVAQISTQSITHAKAAQNVSSIILLGYVDSLGSNMVQYNLDAAISADTAVGDSIVFASCTTGANNGTFTIVEIGRAGGNNVVISNASGVAQTGAAGTAQEKIMSYNYTNPVSSTGFTAGYSHDFASHTSAANDGDLLVYAINQSGNNIWVKNASGVTQGGVAGTADTNFWQFNLSGAASSTDYIVSESVTTASHTSANNDSGALTIIAVNSGGNNLILYNTAGVTQGGVAGTINTNRWVYNLPTDPTTQVTAGDTMFMSGHTSALNDGTFTIKETSASTVVVFNASGLAQGGAAGNVYTTKKLVKFSSDQSAVYTTDSYIEMQNCVSSEYNLDAAQAPFRVLQVNRGGGANYNVVVDLAAATSQASPAGYVQHEMKSIFSSAPSLAASLTGLEPNLDIVGSSTSFVAATISAQVPVMLYITSYPSGDPRDLTVTLL
jgi:hypothetical protein